MSNSKLTPTAVENAVNVISPEGISTLSLRGRRILYIENLEFTKNAFGAIDLTNNDIVEFSGVPDLPNLEVLLLGNNNISTVAQNTQCGVKSLSLMNNDLSSFAEVAKLRILRRLEHLVMMGNHITHEHHYRLFVVWLFPQLRVLDCQKVKAKEREEAKELFGPSYEDRLPAADALINGSKSIEPQEPASKETRLMETTMKKLSPEEKAKLVEELQNASSMEEIERISNALKAGYVGDPES
ncbi:hypothetical protein JCM33374_g2510 [Metschnikowia sp. JCM 33374]|nr:hypothetical protein JCM33374_g2510 [Metschnikowia sp. JCM 33374]